MFLIHVLFSVLVTVLPAQRAGLLGAAGPRRRLPAPTPAALNKVGMLYVGGICPPSPLTGMPFLPVQRTGLPVMV